jgi:endonuclease YncB( thermonuclease family)
LKRFLQCAVSQSLELLLAGVLACMLAGPGAARAAPPAKPAPAPPVQIEGVVTAVARGDVLSITPAAGPPVQVRLRDIAAPEPCQDWGEESRQALADLAINKQVVAHLSGRSAGTLPLASVTVDGLDLGPQMVETGNAWSARTRFDQGPLMRQERLAQALHRGLHAKDDAVRPEVFRRAHGPCTPAPR